MRRSGFTLIDILIITVLAGLMTTAVVSSKIDKLRPENKYPFASPKQRQELERKEQEQKKGKN